MIIMQRSPWREEQCYERKDVLLWWKKTNGLQSEKEGLRSKKQYK